MDDTSQGAAVEEQEARAQAAAAESAPTPFQIALMDWFTKKQTEIARRQQIAAKNRRVAEQFVAAGRRVKIYR